MKTRFALFYLLIFFFAATTNSSRAQVQDLKFERITTENGLPQNTIHGIVKDKYGFMWFGTWGGLCRYDGYSFKVYKYDRLNSKSINNNQIHNVVKDADQNVWVLTFKNDELCRYNYNTDDFERIPSKNVSASLLEFLNRRNHYKDLRFAHKQFGWEIDTNSNRLVQTNLATKQKKVYMPDLANRWSLSDSYVTDIYKDDQNVFWVGTYSNGINKANLDAKPFEYFYSNPGQSNSIVDNNVRTISEDKKGNLWIGTRDQGISVISGDKYRHITANSSGNTIPDNQIKVIFCDSRGTTWIGTRNGLTNYNPGTGSFLQFFELGFNYTSVYGITEDKQGNLWFATWKGVYKYIASEKRIKHFNPEKTLLSRHARVVITDRAGLIWVGTEGGGVTVLKSVPGSDSVVVTKNLVHTRSQVNSIIDDRINCLYQDTDGAIWIGTGNGLDKYDPKSNKFLHLPAHTAIADIIVAGIIEDNRGFLWVSHKTGIIKLNKKTLAIRHYTLKDGLQSNEFANGAVLKSRFNNKLYFGGNNGFNAFNPDSIFAEKTLPRTVLTELQILNQRVALNEKVNGRVVLVKPLYLTEQIELNYEDKAFAFAFSGLHYSNSQGNKYAYKLEGFDNEWVYTDASNRVARYSNLKPGKYIFKVISSNSDGVWNENPATIGMIVNPPLWASTWAYIFYAVLLFLIIYIYHQYSNRFSRLRAKISYESLIREKENELHQSKLQFFTNISHEIKTPLSLILAPLDKLTHRFSNDPGTSMELDTMKVNANRLLKLLNQLLDFRKMETGNQRLYLREHDIIAFLDNFIKSFKPLAEMKAVNLEFVHDEKSFSFTYDEEKIEKVIANLLTNAFKFTPRSGWIKVKFKAAGELAVIEVINFGKVIPDDERENIFMPFVQGAENRVEGTGLGLAFSKGIVDLHGGKISVVSYSAGESMGETRFRIELPASSDTLSEISRAASPSSETLEPVVVQQADELQQEGNEYEEQQDQVLLNRKLPVLLIVEDNDDLRRYLKGHFESDYDVIEAENGKSGLDIALIQLPDIILSDVMMPEMDGFELCRRIKSDVATNHIPLILLTAKAPVEYQIEGIEMGADDYLVKPFNFDLLSLKIKNMLLARARMQTKFKSKLTIQPSAINPESPDEKLLKKLLLYIEEKISDPELSMESICTDIGLSRTQLYRKMKAMTGLGVAEMIKEIRLNRAQQLLRDTKFNISEIAYMVGFTEADYFRRCFKTQFGVTPSEYIKKFAEDNT